MYSKYSLLFLPPPSLLSSLLPHLVSKRAPQTATSSIPCLCFPSSSLSSLLSSPSSVSKGQGRGSVHTGNHISISHRHCSYIRYLFIVKGFKAHNQTIIKIRQSVQIGHHGHSQVPTRSPRCGRNILKNEIEEQRNRISNFQPSIDFHIHIITIILTFCHTLHIAHIDTDTYPHPSILPSLSESSRAGCMFNPQLEFSSHTHTHTQTRN